MPGPLVLEVQPQALPVARRRSTPASSCPPPPCIERVARQLAGGGDHLGLVDEAEAAAPGRACRTACRAQDDVVLGLEGERRQSRYDVHRRRPPVGIGRGRRSAIPRSTFERRADARQRQPSSTSVIATAGCMPTTTVSASRMRAMRRDVGDHPADERVDDLERRRCRSARRGRRSARSASVRSSCSVSASGRACRPGW